MRFREQRNMASILVAGVPRIRGTPIHFESGEGGTAYCKTEDKRVLEIHTPDEAFPRVHEYMHALHSDEANMEEHYSRVGFEVANVTEDIRIHMKFWPWHGRPTPATIKDGTRKFLAKEMRELAQAIAADDKMRGSWPDFATRLRQAAIKLGMIGPTARTMTSAVQIAGFATAEQKQLAYSVLAWVLCDEQTKAAEYMQALFFGGLIERPRLKDDDEDIDVMSMDSDDTRSGSRKSRTVTVPWAASPHMEIIELEHSVKIEDARIGKKRGTTGGRLHRPSLRKVVLPQRMFVRKARRIPQGTVLVDASGSMGSFEEITRWVEKLPFGTVAYYAGIDAGRGGWLYVYARNGKRAVEPRRPPAAGNCVDGPAIDWLLSQSAPRIMVTDRGFCGAPDSFAQKMRLGMLEQQGLIQVQRYWENEEE